MIRSTRNPRVRELAALSRPRTRRERGLHLAEGPGPVAEALAAGLVLEVLVGPGASGPETGATPVTAVSEAVLVRLSDTRSPRGPLAVVRTPGASLADALAGELVLVLHEVGDPGNAGTILRTADAAGASGVVATRGSVDVFSPKALRAAAGSTYHLPVAVDVRVEDLLAAAGSRGCGLLGLDAAGDVDVLADELPPAPLGLVLGNEAHGLPADLVERFAGLAAVPIHGRAESLNVAAAAAVALYAASPASRRHRPAAPGS